MKELIQNPMFGILLSLLAFEIGVWIQKKTKLLLLNPLLIAIVLIILLLISTGIPLSSYQVGGDMIQMFLGPATVVLAIPLYRQANNLKHYFVEIMVGITAGVATGLLSTIACSMLMHFDSEIMASILPKSITTPIGIELSAQLGGIQAVTVLTILITGIMGAVVADVVFRIFHIDHPIAKGIALGTSAHAIGTTKALSLGHIEGAMSSLAIGVSGLFTVFVAPMIWDVIITLM